VISDADLATPIMLYVLVAVIWLCVTSLAVTIGRAIRSPLVAYPVAAVSSFVLLVLILVATTAVSSLGLLTALEDTRQILGQE
jgi:hypothetical protein